MPRSDEEEQSHHDGGDMNDDREEDAEGEEGEEIPERVNGRRRQKKKNDDDGGGAAAKGLMDDSGLTESDRRKLRKDQRELLKEMEDHDAMELDEARDRNNELYKNVCFTREAVLDGDNLIVIANKARKQTDRMIQVRCVSLPRRFLNLPCFR